MRRRGRTGVQVDEEKARGRRKVRCNVNFLSASLHTRCKRKSIPSLPATHYILIIYFILTLALA